MPSTNYPCIMPHHDLEEIYGDVSSRKRALIWEVATLLSFLCLPSILQALLNSTYYPAVTNWQSGFELLSWSLGILAVFLFVLWRSGDAWESFGLSKKVQPLDFLVLVLAVGLGLAATGVAITVQLHEWRMDKMPAFNLIPPVVHVFNASIAIVSGLLTEVFHRGYLLTRFRELFGTTGLAISNATLLWCLTVFMQSPTYLALQALVSVLFSLYFIKTMRIWPIVLAQSVSTFVYMSFQSSSVIEYTRFGLSNQ